MKLELFPNRLLKFKCNQCQINYRIASQTGHSCPSFLSPTYIPFISLVNVGRTFIFPMYLPILKNLQKNFNPNEIFGECQVGHRVTFESNSNLPAPLVFPFTCVQSYKCSRHRRQ